MRPWEIPQFLTGLVAGVVAAAGLVAVSRSRWRRRAGFPVPLGGVAFAAAALAALALDRSIPAGLAVGLVGLGASLWLASGRLHVLGTVLLAAPFAYLIAFRGDLPEVTWIRALTGVAAAVVGVLVLRADERWRREALAPPLLLLTVVGVYFTVPDTEEAAVILGVALPLAALGWPLRWVRLGAPGAAMASGLVCWVAAIGGRGRPASIIGALACFALIAGVAAASQRAGSPLGRLLAPNVVVVAALHLGLVYVASRVAGVRSEVAEAALLAGGVLLASVVLGRYLVARSLA